MQRIFAALLAAFTFSNAYADEKALIDFGNGCGPKGFLGYFVPDSPFVCKFKQSCNKHDNCYSACLPGGRLNSPTCPPDECLENKGASYFSPACITHRENRAKRKQMCDSQFNKDLVEENEGRCSGLAGFYNFIVTSVGGGFFDGLKIQDLKNIVENSTDLEQAVLRLRLIKSLKDAKAIRLSELVVSDDGTISAPARDSLVTRLKSKGVISIDPKLHLSEIKIQPLLDLGNGTSMQK